MAKIDHKKALKHLYQASAKTIAEVEVPEFRFLMVDGEGDPNTSHSYAEAVEALFAVSYTAKFMLKKNDGTDYAVMPLEGLWWADDLSVFVANDKSQWKWTMMIMQPTLLPSTTIDAAIGEVKRKKNPAGLARLRLETFTEGHCAQILHIGPFSEEGPVIELVHQFIDARGERAGKHHEIYLSDIRRGNPARWKTIIRQPMQRPSSKPGF